MADADVRIPAEARDRLTEVAAAEGLSLRAYLARLAQTLLTREWNGYDPAPGRPDGAVIATAAPQRWAARPVRILDLDL
ncbi:hypothetical protein [Parafrankia discariae]|uniref:hypothetical protein n=1 Tax=Parafrankia discariae TaxID=365528 RepID=UPI0003725C88|nr:hypothetical protein [Parafrankia discariae]